LYYQLETRSESASRKIEEVITAYRQDLVVRRLSAQGLSEGFVKPVKAEEENVAAAEKVSGMKLSMIVPYFIIFLSLMGAMHPAMDLTAGEKERGTLETILASSVHRGEIVLGKFLLVLTVSLTTTVVSLASFGFTASRSQTYMTRVVEGKAAVAAPAYHLSLQAIGSILLLVLPLAILFSAALVAVSLAAKSYKEAQSYVSPLMIFVIVPALAGILPGVELSPALAMVPITNVSLVTRELLTGSFPFLFMAITFASSCLYAGIALYFAYTQFQREEVLFRT
jgi:sodium transport system permease protein